MYNIYISASTNGRSMYASILGIFLLIFFWNWNLSPLMPKVSESPILSDTIIIPENLQGQTEAFWEKNQEYLLKHYNNRFSDTGQPNDADQLLGKQPNNGSTPATNSLLLTCSDLHEPSSPSCSGGELIWNNPVTVNGCNVSTSVRFVGGGKIQLNLPAEFSNPIDISIDEAISWDGYENRPNVGAQTSEFWRVVFVSNGVYTYSSYTSDIQDFVMSAEAVSSLGSFSFPNGIDEMWLVHGGENAPYGDGISGPNSVVPVSVCISYTLQCEGFNPDVSGDNEICKGESTTLTASGGDSYSWSTGSSNPSISVSPNSDNTYYVTITNDDGCSSEESIHVTVGEAVWEHVNVGSHPTCEHPCGGSIIVNPNYSKTGDWNLQYTFDGNLVELGPFSTSGDYTISNLCGGTYENITIVSVATGCTDNYGDITLNTPNAPTVAPSANDPCTGQTLNLSANASGGAGSYEYNWTGPNSFSSHNANPSIHNVSFDNNGTYYVTVTDGDDCTATGSIEINITSGVTAGLSKDMDWNCNNPGGVATLTATPASGVTYSWSAGVSPVGGTNTGTVDNAGTFYVTVTDGNGCSDVASVTVIEDKTAPSAQLNASGSITCNNATVTLTALPAGMQYDWPAGATPVGANTATVTAGGSYTVTVTDPDNGCSNTATTNVQTEINPPSVSVSKDGDLDCENSSVYISAQPQGAHYTWDVPAGASNPGNTHGFTTSVGGTYTVTVTDGNGCTASASVTVGDYDDITLSLSYTNPSCAGNDGSITGTEYNPTDYCIVYALYNYTIGDWVTGYQSSPNFSGLSAGHYRVKRWIDENCDGGSHVICYARFPDETTIELVIEDDIDVSLGDDITVCKNTSTTLTAALSGGDAPFFYSWSDGQSGNGLNSISVSPSSDHTYGVTVTDDNGCTSSDHIFVDVKRAVLTQVYAIDATCEGVNDGKLYVDPSVNSGTVLPIDIYYTFDGNEIYAGSYNHHSDNYVTGLAPGSYTNVRIVDANGCEDSESGPFVIGTGTTITVHANGTDPDCSGDTGSANASASGGHGPYTYSWSNGASGSHINGLAAGTYTVTATDDNGCTGTASVTITEPDPVTASAIATDATCNGESDGSISVSAGGGGVSLYDITWDGPGSNDGSANNQSSPYNITGLPAGSYDITVIDANGCEATTSATVNEPALVTASASANDVTCNGDADGSISVIATGTSPYDITWDGPGGNDGTANNQSSPYSINDLPAGTYNITVVDDNGCEATTSATVNESDAVAASASANDVTCNAGADGSIDVSVSGGGVSPYDISWDGPGTNDGSANDQASPYTITGLEAGTYDITVVDANGCEATTSTTVNEPGPVTASASANDVTCNGDADGSISVTATGTSPYDISWDGPATNDGSKNNQSSPYSITDLPAGTYDITVVDANGCEATTSATVNESEPVTASASPIDVTCNGDSDGSISVSIGGVAPFDIKWEGPGANDGSANNQSSPYNITGLPAGSYDITVVDANGCEATTSATVGEPDAVVASASANDVTCNAGADGSIDVSVSGGGVSPYDISWDGPGANDGSANNQTSPYTITGLEAGTYDITVVDANGCQATTSATVNESDAVAASASANDVTCNAGADGSIDVSVSGGGVSPYDISWDGPGTNDGSANDQASPYTITGLEAGTYDITVVDANGCEATTSATVGEPDAVVASASANDVTCNAGADGSIDVSVSGWLRSDY